MIIIDPDREGCTVWYKDKVQHICGSPQECIDRILNFAVKNNIPIKKGNLLFDYEAFTPNEIAIDTTGEGRYFAMVLDDMRIWYDEIKGCRFL